MNQEVKVTLQTEFDCKYSKSDIKHIVQTVLNQSPVHREVILTVIDIKEEAEIYGNKLNPEEKFPNGFESWQETHFEIVSQISYYSRLDKCTSNVVNKAQEEQGTGGLYELAKALTNEFEKIHKGREWDGEFFDEVENFLTEKLK